MNTSRSLPRRAVTTAATVAAAALILTACGDNGGNGGGTSTSTHATSATPGASATPSVPAGPHNQADVTFAQGMIPHHRQAVVMAEMAESHASSSDVKALAEKIKKAQAPEIETMTGWLKAWGEQVPAGMGGMDHGGPSGMPGMMGDHEMGQLKGASGSAFDKMFLTMMITHHEGAIEMANTEKRQGAYGPAKEMADTIVTSQTAEIAQMRKMLGTSSPSPT
ncbi:DUF305 domain-containing protein [Streptomyces sp. NPDC053048]|uniref:DUF305 domain-containing protein n=1 Tax=Streptomyces sp. NPDC053048 TaxID=3365694 RepID=UPI0037CE6CC5